MTIRRAKPSDAEGIAAAIRSSYEQLPAAHVPYDMPLYHAEHHVTAMHDAGLRWAVLCTQGIVRGVASWRMLPGLAHLHQLFVAGEHQRRGYGVALLRYHQQDALAEQPDLRLFTLHCMQESYWALRFYRHHGYTVYVPGDEGRLTDLYTWIDACRRHDAGWPLKEDKLLLYKKVG